jgi:HrpA-like RNA helicase
MSNLEIGILDPLGKNVNPLNNQEYSDNYRELAKKWSKFPAYEKRNLIISSIIDNNVTLIISGTGSGKTVLLPKYMLHVLNYNGKIAVTLPKQMIAKSSAEYSALTLDVELGKEVGYQYRGSDKSSKSKESKLLYVTDGTIVARLLNDPYLQEYDAVIIDEAHERKVQIDFMLYLLRNTIKLRSEFKLIIMSATINEKIFSDYFSKFSFNSINLSSKTNYKITSIFLDKPITSDQYIKKGFEIITNIVKSQKGGKDHTIYYSDTNSNLYNSHSSNSSNSSNNEKLTNHKTDTGVNYSNLLDLTNNTNSASYANSESYTNSASYTNSENSENNINNENSISSKRKRTIDSEDILFFVTSKNEAESVCQLINKNNLDGYCIEVYSGMNKLKEKYATSKDAYTEESSKRIKIVVATNVAESSVTIDGIKYVIDSGYEYSGFYDPETGARKLDKQFITHAQVKQRMGRAGRTEPGTCYHLYTEDQFNNMKKFPEPDIRTSNITSECLKLLSMDSIKSISNLKNILSQFIEPPKTYYIQHAIDQLTELDLIDNDELSQLGKMVSDTQLDPMMGLSIIKSIELECSYEVLAIMVMIDTAHGSMGKIFNNPLNNLSRDDPKFKEKQKYLTDKLNKAKSQFKHKTGDHISILKIFNLYTKLLEDKKEDKYILNWCFTNFINANTMKKAVYQYKRLRRKIRDIKSSIKINEEYKDRKLDDKILISIQTGFKLHIAKLKNNSYVTKYTHSKDIIISKDSFIQTKPSQVIFYELFIGLNKKDLNIVSII